MTRWSVLVKPSSRRGPEVIVEPDGTLTVHVRERAIEGAANAGVVAALAEHFGVKRGDITIARGHTGRYKLIDIAD